MRPRHGVGRLALLGLLLLFSLFSVFHFPSKVFGYTPHATIFINGNRGFTSANGVTGGNGTVLNPYVIEGWDINAYSNSSSSTIGVSILNADEHFVIRNVRAHDGFTGIYLHNATNGRVENNVASNNRGYGINSIYSKNIRISDNTLDHDLDGGVLIQYSSNTTVSNNVITNTGGSIGGTAVLVEWSNNTFILGNSASGNPGGIGVYSSSQAAVNYNSLQNNSFTINLLSSSYVNVTQNNVLNNGDAISSWSSNNTSILYNIISSNTGTGIRLSLSNDTAIYTNKVSGNRYGITLGGSNRVYVQGNLILNNTIQASDSGGDENAWNATYPIGGNYWNPYSGSDNCSGPFQNICPSPDNIGDTPYIIDTNSRDNYPLMVPPTIPDIYPPQWPKGSSLASSFVTPTSIALSWTIANDNVGVESYRIYQNGTLMATLPGTANRYVVRGLTFSTTYTFKVEAGDEAGNWSTDGPSSTIATPRNAAPMLIPIEPRTVDEETLFTFNTNATDPDGDHLYFVLGPGPPTGASISPDGVFSWTPTEAQGPGTYPITIQVSDGLLMVSQTFNVTVREVDKPPVLGPIGNKITTQGTLLTFTATGTDPDIPANDLTFSLAPGAPPGASITPNGVFNWTPNKDQNGVFVITIIVSDGSLTDSETIQVTVKGDSQSTSPGPILNIFGPLWWLPLAAPALALLVITLVRRKSKRFFRAKALT